MSRPRALEFFRALACLASLAACSATLPPPGQLTSGERRQLEHAERALAEAPERLRDAKLEAFLAARLHDIDPAGAPLRLYLLDRREPAIDVLGDRVLRIRLGLLLALRDEAELVFVLAHESAHRTLGHVDARRRPGWDPQAAELAADAQALETLRVLGYRGDAGLTLLQRLAPLAQSVDALALIRSRMLRLQGHGTAPATERASRDRLAPLLAPYRARSD